MNPWRTAATQAAEAESSAASAELWQNDQRLLDRMQEIADTSRHLPDAKARRLIDWIRAHLCPDLPALGQVTRGRPARWNARRLLIFAENREGTQRWLRQLIEEAIASTDQAERRLETVDGNSPGPLRREIQRRFNTDPAKEPLRILLATDAARSVDLCFARETSARRPSDAREVARTVHRASGEYSTDRESRRRISGKTLTLRSSCSSAHRRPRL